MGKDTDDAIVTFGTWIVTGILVVIIGGGVAVGVSMVAGPIGAIISFVIVTIIIVIAMTRLLKKRYKM